MSLKFLLIVALCGIHVNATSNIFNSWELLNEFGRELYRIIDTEIKNDDNNRSIIHDMFDAMDKLSGGNENSDNINDKLRDILPNLDYIVRHREHEISKIEEEMQELSIQSKIDLVRRGILDDIKNIATMTDQTSVEDVQSSLASLFDRTVGQGIDDLTSNFLELYEEYWRMGKEELCGSGLSPNNYLYSLYTLIVTAEMMGLISFGFYYESHHELHKNSSIDQVFEAAQKEREGRLLTYFTKFRLAIDDSPVDYRSCDPPEHNRGDTFFEMEGLYHTILTQEYGKNYPHSCLGDCDTINMENYQENGKICGRISQCSTIEDPAYCELTGQLRKYQWIKSAGHTYGIGSMCSGVENYTAVWFLKSERCETCRCTCEGNSLELVEKNSNSTHVISLLPVSSDISNNMTITGVRLRVTAGIVHIQIKEGQLQAAGQVTSSSTWKDVPDMGTEIYLARNGSSSIYQEGRDFIVIDQYHNAINLDDVMAPDDHLITGLKWGLAQKSETDPGWRLEIQIQCTPFNFTSGALGNSTVSQWMSSSAIHNQPLELGENDNPEKSTDLNILTKAPKGFVKFMPSSFAKDAGQSTIPFLDGVPVESRSGPLAGIGLFHKAAKGYAGFLSLRLYSLNMAAYMSIDPDSAMTQTYYYVHDDIDDSEQDDDSQANKTVLKNIDSNGSARKVLLY